MPVDLPAKREPLKKLHRPPQSFPTDMMDGLAFAFCILIIVWGSQHFIFDYLTDPNVSLESLWAQIAGSVSTITDPATWRI